MEDINTAPKDGTRILAYRPGWAESFAVCYWNKDFGGWWVAAGGSEFVGVAFWSPLPAITKTKWRVT